MQAAAGVNVAGARAEGLQVAAGVNVARDGMTGAQMAAGVSIARSIEGAQISVINIGGAVDGAQIGVINVATGKVDGTQIGVLNYADEADAPIGVLSIVRKGQFHLDVWADETSAANVGLKIGSRHLYGIFTAGASGGQTADDRQRWTAGLGLGGHVPVGSPLLSFVNVELLGRNVFYGSDWGGDDGALAISSLRLAGGWQVLPRLAIVAGPTFNVSVSTEGDRGGFGLFGRTAELHGDEVVAVRAWPGFFAGLQF
jgi:hypothetical protein